MIPSVPPQAFSGTRLGWWDLPRHVRDRISALAGASVVAETSATSGFSPGYASLLSLGDGTEVFVKAVSPDQNPDSPVLARAEAQVAARLPREVPAPALLWSHDDGHWVVLGFQAVHGRLPAYPWREEDLASVLGVLIDLVETGTPSPAGLPPLSDAVDHLARGWVDLEADGAAVDRAVGAVGPHGPWLRRHLSDLVERASVASTAAGGGTLVHGDLRADNVLLDNDGSGRVWVVDWPHAAGEGAAWFDLLGMLPSVAMQGGGDLAGIFWAHPNAVGADRDAVRAVLTAVAGYFVGAAVRPPPPNISNLRPFQLAQGRAALDWLRGF